MSILLGLAGFGVVFLSAVLMLWLILFLTVKNPLLFVTFLPSPACARRWDSLLKMAAACMSRLGMVR